MFEKLKGTGVALASPMKDDLSLDFGGLSKLINHVIEGGVDYLVVLGTTGESPTISWEEKLEMLDFCIEKIQGKLPLVFGLGGNNTSALLKKLDELDGRNIDAILSASPYYNKPSQEGIFAHYTALALQSTFPVIIYNVPQRTASNVTAETTLRLAKHPNIIGIKEASGDLQQCSIIAKEKPSDFLLLSGEDFITIPILSMGGEGVISVVANAYPKIFCQMVNASLNEEVKNAKILNQKLSKYYALTTKEGNPSSIKAALASLDICKTNVRLPLIPASTSLIEEFRNTKR